MKREQIIIGGFILAAVLTVIGVVIGVMAYKTNFAREEMETFVHVQEVLSLQEEEAVIEPTVEEGGDVYVLYSLNVHDWTHPRKSAQTVEEVLSLHEKYGVPVEIFVTDPVFQIFVHDYPDLIKRLRTSEVVSVSYHLRPPTPYYPDFDWLGLEELTAEERTEILFAYEEHEIDLETGEVTENPGGYQFVKETMGYAPRIVGFFDAKAGGQELVDIYTEKGVQFIVEHGKEIPVGKKKLGIFVRPETYDLKIYEYALVQHVKTAEEIFAQATSSWTGEADYFIGVKYHENNFYHDDNPWYPVFWNNGLAKDGLLYPPYDISAALTDFRTGVEERRHWELYEDSLQYVTENRETFTALNAVGLLEEFDWE